MKKLFVLILLLTVVSTGQLALSGQGSTTGQGLSFPVSTTGTAITSAPYDITIPGTYYVANTLNCPSYCISVGVSGVIIHGNGQIQHVCTNPAGQAFTISNEAVTRGVSDPNGADPIATDGKGGTPAVSTTAVFRIQSYTKISNTNGGAANYTEGTDYIAANAYVGHGPTANLGKEVNWSPAGAEPSSGATYYVSYVYTEPCYGIVFADAFDSDRAGAVTFPTSAANLTDISVTGTQIFVPAGSPPKSAGILLGGSAGSAGRFTVDHNLVSVDCVSCSAVELNSKNLTVTNNTLLSNGTGVFFRDYNEASGVRSWGNDPNANDVFSGNLIRASAQNGIVEGAGHAHIFNNTIINNQSRYSNDFAILCTNPGAANCEVDHNYVDLSGGSGRGLGVYNNSGTNYHDNTVIVRGLSQNLEYGGCESGGYYGLQADTMSSGSIGVGESITALADDCPGKALRVTDSPSGSTLSAVGGAYVCKRIGSTAQPCVGASFDAPQAFTLDSATVTADDYVVAGDFDGLVNVVVKNSTLAKGANPSAGFKTIFVPVLAGDPTGTCGAGPCNLALQDNTFTNGAADTDYSIGSTTSGHAFDLYIKYSYTPTYTANGAALAGAAVTITDSQSNVIYSGTTDASGNIGTQVLTKLKASATATTPTTITYNPFAIAVSNAGCTTLNYSLTITAKVAETKAVSCP